MDSRRWMRARKRLYKEPSLPHHFYITKAAINSLIQSKHHLRPKLIPFAIKFQSFRSNPQTFNMQFKNIVAFVSLAVMATALPADNLVRRTDSEDAAAQCSANQSGTLKCCNTVTSTFFGLLGSFPIGNGCELISVLDVLSNQCTQSQEVACCKDGDQVGLVNVDVEVCQIL
ncbi:MAG: hypothetical protein LQ341_004711 [Variospora aurantia]|nr:MAG: hypothetical protein LQ341_004711 [Variospora aurantia]